MAAAVCPKATSCYACEPRRRPSRSFSLRRNPASTEPPSSLARPRPATDRSGLKDFEDLRSEESLRSVRLFVLDGLTLVERTKPITRDGRVVDEHVLAIVLTADEAVTLGIVEPLDGTERHFTTSLTSSWPTLRPPTNGLTISPSGPTTKIWAKAI